MQPEVANFPLTQRADQTDIPVIYVADQAISFKGVPSIGTVIGGESGGYE